MKVSVSQLREAARLARSLNVATVEEGFALAAEAKAIVEELAATEPPAACSPSCGTGQHYPGCLWQRARSWAERAGAC